MELKSTFVEDGVPLAGAEAEPFRRAVSAHLPGRTAKAVVERGTWGRRIVEVTLDNGEVVFVKVNVHSGPEWLPGGERHEQDVAAIFAAHGLPAPRVMAVDSSCQIIPHPYVIQARVGGTRLGTLLGQVTEADAEAIYAAVGSFYARLHAIRGDHGGVWTTRPDETLGPPEDFMVEAEIVGGSGRRALDQGRITRRTYDRAVALWAANRDYLKAYRPTLIHFSAFPWNIYLERAGGGWQVAKLMSMGDVMWWDPAWDVACLRYPPFGETSPRAWEALRRGYGPEPERKRMLLYLVMQRLCAAMGIYMAPPAVHSQAWADHCLADLDAILDEIEAW
jgi:hypothetical protein